MINGFKFAIQDNCTFPKLLVQLNFIYIALRHITL